MYGIIHTGSKDAVIALGGPEAWTRVLSHCGFNDEHMISAANYDDAQTIALVEAIAHEFGVDLAEALRIVGRNWIKFSLTAGYGNILDMCGDNLASFLRNLDRMHKGLKSSLPDARMPSFQLLSVEGDKLMLSYTSTREGFAPMVEGILEGLIEHFDEPYRINIVPEGQRSIFFLHRVETARLHEDIQAASADSQWSDDMDQPVARQIAG